MQLFFDTEFTGLHKDTTLISIGIVGSAGECFYGICTDYDESQVNDWISENVIDRLELSDDIIDNVVTVHRVTGTKADIRKAFLKWLEFINAEDEDIELVSDVCHYDMTLFVDLFGTAFDLPENICPCCYDINQDIANYYGITMSEAFDISRESLADELIEQSREYLYEYFKYLQELPDECKHNALYDALIIRAIHTCMFDTAPLPPTY